VENLNQITANNVFADLVACRHGVRYLISVKARNRLTQVGRLNASYNLLKIRDVKNRILKERGLSQAAITSLLLGEVSELAQRASATAAWVTVSIDAVLSEYDCFFGLVSDLGARRSIPMTAQHTAAAAIAGFTSARRWARNCCPAKQPGNHADADRRLGASVRCRSASQKGRMKGHDRAIQRLVILISVDESE